MNCKKMLVIGIFVIGIGVQCLGAASAESVAIAYDKLFSPVPDEKYIKLMESIAFGDTIAGLELIKTGVSHDAVTLCEAARIGRAAIVDALLTKNALPNAAEWRVHGKPALFYAAEFGETVTMKILLDGGAWIDSTDELGSTALHETVTHNQIEAMKLLLDHGASVKIANRFDQTALHLAVLLKRFNAMRPLLDNGASIDICNRMGYTVLQTAIFNKNIPAIKLLLAHGASFTQEDMMKILACWPTQQMVGLLINARYDALLKRYQAINDMKDINIENQKKLILPSEVWEIIATYFASGDLSNFRLACKDFRTLAHLALLNCAAKLKNDMCVFIASIMKTLCESKEIIKEKEKIINLLEIELENAKSLNLNKLLQGVVVCDEKPWHRLQEYIED